MLSLFLLGVARYAQLLILAFVSLFDRRRRFTGAALALLVWPLIVALQIVHWIFWCIDELVFAGYRQVAVKKPVFVIGPPRTGTTFLHRVLADDDTVTTFRLWECLFGFTITGHKLCTALARLDRALGSPIRKLAGWIAGSAASDLDDVHPLALDAPEEDFLTFLPFAACFLLVVPYPTARWLFRFSRFDIDVPERDRRHVMRWYRRCIQKHLYVNGTDLRFLSKNASFGGMTEALLKEFPDARILTTWRDPVAAVPSQLSSLAPSLAWFGFRSMPRALRDRLVDQMGFYYRHIAETEARHRDRVIRITTTELRVGLKPVITTAFETLGLPISESLQRRLDSAQEESRQHQSSHHYSAEDFGLTDDLIRSRFDAEQPDDPHAT